jgi:hypothetical protein
LKMLRSWATNPESIYKELAGFERRFNELAGEYLNDPVKAMDVLLQEMHTATPRLAISSVRRLLTFGLPVIRQ